MKWLVCALVIALLYLQYRLWIADGSIATVVQLQTEIDKQTAENSRLRAHNRVLSAEVEALKTDPSAIEERARTDLGLIKKDETFFMLLPSGKEGRSGP